MNKHLVIFLIAANAAATFALAQELQPSAPSPEERPSISIDAVRGVLDALDADKIGNIMSISCQFPGKVSVLTGNKLEGARPDDDGSFYFYELVDGKWTLTEKGSARMH